MNPPDLDPPTIPVEKWQALDALWKSILGVEAMIDGVRLSASGLVSEMDSAFRQALTVEEKQHASQADVGQWTAAKSRIHYSAPKVREFIHKATWAATTPERKRVEEAVRTHLEPRVPPPDFDKMREEMEHLMKARQVLLAQGNAVSQEGRSLTAELTRVLATLRRNAADNAKRKREGKRR